jgi:hypothetical protein
MGRIVKFKTEIRFKLKFKIVTKKSLEHSEGRFREVPYCTHQSNERLYAFFSSPIHCPRTQHPDKAPLPRNLNIITRLKPKRRLRTYDDRYRQLQTL